MEMNSEKVKKQCLKVILLPYKNPHKSDMPFPP